MKHTYLQIIPALLIVISFRSLSGQTKSNLLEESKEKQWQKISFTENKGQVSDQNSNARPDILFSGNAYGMVYHLRNNGISYQLSRVDSWNEEKRLPPFLMKGKAVKKMTDKITSYRLDINWLGINKNFTIQTEKALQGYNNYYLAVCPSGVSGVKTFESVYYNNIYAGINLHYYQKNNGLKYDYIVKPGANYKLIKFEVRGAETIRIQHDGSILFVTPLGKIQEGAPLVYQEGKKLPARWVMKNNELSFDIYNYDSTKELIIDPATRAWGTYYGGTGVDDGHSCANDANGNVYLAGFSESNTSIIIATSGSHQSTFGGGNSDTYLVKFNSAGIRQWATYYGDVADEIAYTCCTDASGNVFLTGYTDVSTGTVIATAGSHQFTCGGNIDAFLVKFNSVGIRQWGTYYGGQGWDYGTVCSTDPSGNVYLTGWTGSGNGTAIASTGSHQSVLSGGFDAFLVKFNSSGVRQWSTYYGGTGDEQGFSCAADANGNVYLSGWTETNTSTIIATVGAHQSLFGGGTYDAFLVKFNSTGVRQWGTYYGGSSDDLGYAGAIDLSGNVYLAGYTDSNTGTVIATSGSHQSNFGGNTADAFLVKFNSAGVRQWGTYYGGGSIDASWSCTTDLSGNIFLAGSTGSNNGTAIATVGGHQAVYGGGGDAFLVKFDGSGLRQWSTYYGGFGGEEALSCSADASGNVYLAGNTDLNTSTVIATVGSHQSAFGGNYSDAFLVKFCNSPTITVNSGSICAGDSFTIVPGGASTYTFQGGNSVVSPVVNTSYTIVGTNTDGCISDAPAISNITVNASPTVVVNSGSICAGNSFTIVPSGANTYTLQGGNTVVSPIVNTTYTVVGTNSLGCNSAPVTSTVTVMLGPTPSVSSNYSVLCLGESSTLTAYGANSYTWSTLATGPSIIVTPSVAMLYTYSVTAEAINGCNNIASTQIKVNKCTEINEIGTNSARLLVYPNPNKGTFNIICNTEIVLNVVNQLGQVISIVKLSPLNNYQGSVSELASGIYFISGENNYGKVYEKIVVNK